MLIQFQLLLAFLPVAVGFSRIELPRAGTLCFAGKAPRTLTTTKTGSYCSSRSSREKVSFLEGQKVGATSETLPASLQACETTDDVNIAVQNLCADGKFDAAIDLVLTVEEAMKENDAAVRTDYFSYFTIINALARQRNGAKKAQEMMQHMESMSKKDACYKPKGQVYSAVVTAWSNSKHPKAAEKADALLDELWSLYNATHDSAYLPTRATYTSVITAWARCSPSKQAAERAEELLEEMEANHKKYPLLGPTIASVNAVLNAWSKSNAKEAADRCVEILTRLEKLALGGRPELSPDTVSFNTVIDTLAQSRIRGAPQRAELLLQRMDDLSREQGFPCDPDTISFNTVIKCWTKSGEQASARRAEAILRHIEKRSKSSNANVFPDSLTYSSVIQAWSRSKEPEAPQRAEAVLKMMERAYESGNPMARPDSTAYNSLINVWAKSRHPQAGERAVEILNLMKRKYEDEGRSDCRPDVITYTSAIDAMAKQGSPHAVEQVELLLAEIEDEFRRTGEPYIKPTNWTYTSAINAIARSRQYPERAEAILDRLETACKSGEHDVHPDTVCYNAVINAWGWSNQKGKAENAFNVYQRMMENPNVKPDIITCNSLLNACAFDKADSEEERAAIMDIAVQILEAFQSSAPAYGWPNHITYANMLLAIERQMPMSTKRIDLAEATFWQCCEAGHVSAFVISNLRKAVDDDRLKSIMGSALFVNRKDSFSYDMRKLPWEWRRYAPRNQQPPRRRPQSRKPSQPETARER